MKHFKATWGRIKNRTRNKNAHNFQYYGGRGIKCLWNSFKEFEADMLQSYLQHVQKYGERDTTIERVDVNGHYENANCIWTRRMYQNRNRRTSIRLTYAGKTASVKEISDQLGIPIGALYSRIRLWGAEKAVNTPYPKDTKGTTPINKGVKKFTHCLQEKCTEGNYLRGRCSKHYYQLRKETRGTLKKCPHCGVFFRALKSYRIFCSNRCSGFGRGKKQETVG